MTAPTTCSNCHATLMKQWWDHGLRAYQCRVCNHLTGPEGQALGPAPKASARNRGWLFLGIAVLAIIGLAIAFPQLLGN
jgi:hypothetical protein